MTFLAPRRAGLLFSGILAGCATPPGTSPDTRLPAEGEPAAATILDACVRIHAAGAPTERVHERFTATLHFPERTTSPGWIETWFEAPDRERHEITWQGGALLSVADGPRGGVYENGVLVSRSVEAQVERRRTRRDILAILQREGARVIGRTQIDGRPLWLLERAPTLGGTWRVGIDTEDHSLRFVACRLDTERGPAVWEERLSDHRMVDGVLVAFREESFRDGRKTMERRLEFRRTPDALRGDLFSSDSPGE
jgi:hypothetical protein